MKMSNLTHCTISPLCSPVVLHAWETIFAFNLKFTIDRASMHAKELLLLKMQPHASHVKWFFSFMLDELISCSRKICTQPLSCVFRFFAAPLNWWCQWQQMVKAIPQVVRFFQRWWKEKMLWSDVIQHAVLSQKCWLLVKNIANGYKGEKWLLSFLTVELSATDWLWLLSCHLCKHMRWLLWKSFEQSLA